MDAPERGGATQSIKKVAAASFIGTTIEWYDFFLYGTAAALVFGELFFPESEPLVGTLLAFGTYAVGFAARPIGGDRLRPLRRPHRPQVDARAVAADHGRRDVPDRLLPTFSSIGVLAPILLVVLRFAQGIGVGGEWGGAVLMSVEHAPEGPARLLRLVAADGRARRPAALDRRVRARAGDDERGRVHGVGLARAVPGQRDPRRRRPRSSA